MHAILRRAALAGLVTAVGACYDPSLPDSTPDIAGFLMTLASHDAPADGETTVTIQVRVPPEAHGEDRNVVLTATLGTFDGASGGSLTVAPNSAEIVSVQLHAPSKLGVARIRATLAGVVREDSVVFTAAPPDRVDVDLGKFTLSAGFKNEVTVKTTLRRSIGKVTPGALVTLSAKRADTGEEIGLFSTPSPSDANGEVSARFTAGDTAYRGAAIITATHVGSGVAGSTQIQIVD